MAMGEKLCIRFRRNYVRKGKTMLRRYSGYVKAKIHKRYEFGVKAGYVMLAAVGFNLVKLMKGLRRLFLCIASELFNFELFTSE